MNFYFYLIGLLVIYLIADNIIKNKFRIQERPKVKKGFFKSYKDRKKIFVIIEIMLLVSFFIILFLVPSISSSFAVFVFLFVIWVLQGLEDWLFKRQEKQYYRLFLASLFALAVILLNVLKPL